MPRIPSIQQTESPGVARFPKPTAPGDPVGRALTKAGGALFSVGQHLQAQEDELTLHDLKGQYDSGLKRIQLGLTEDPDYQSHEQKFTKEATKLQKDILSQTDRRPVQQVLTGYFSEKLPKEAVNVRANSMKLWASKQVAELDRQAELFSENAARAGTDEATERVVADYEELVTRAQRRGYFSPEEGERRRQLFRTKVGEKLKEDFIFMVDNIKSNRERLAQFMGELTETKDGKYVNFPYLDPSDRRTMQLDIEKLIAQADKEKEAELKEAQIATGNRFIEKLVNGTLTRTEVLKSNLEPTGENSKKTWIEEIEQREKKKTETFKTDKILEGDLYAQIVEDPEGVSERDILRHVGKGLTKEDAKGLIDERNRRIDALDPFKDNRAKTAIQLLNFARSQRLFDPDDVAKNNEIWSENSLILRDFIQNHPDEDPVEFVNNEIMDPVERSFIGSVLDKFVIGAPSLEQARETKRGRLKERAKAPYIRDEAIEFLKSNNLPITENNIQHYIVNAEAR